MLLEHLERHVIAERQVAAVFIAAGANKVDLPSFEQAKAEFDSALISEPSVADRSRQELLEALGVR